MFRMRLFSSCILISAMIETPMFSRAAGTSGALSDASHQGGDRSAADTFPRSAGQHYSASDLRQVDQLTDVGAGTPPRVCLHDKWNAAAVHQVPGKSVVLKYLICSSSSHAIIAFFY